MMLVCLLGICFIVFPFLLHFFSPLFSSFTWKCYRNIWFNVFFHSIFMEGILKSPCTKTSKSASLLLFLFLHIFSMRKSSTFSKFLLFSPISAFDTPLKTSVSDTSTALITTPKLLLLN